MTWKIKFVYLYSVLKWNKVSCLLIKVLPKCVHLFSAWTSLLFVSDAPSFNCMLPLNETPSFLQLDGNRMELLHIGWCCQKAIWACCHFLIRKEHRKQNSSHSAIMHQHTTWSSLINMHVNIPFTFCINYSSQLSYQHFCFWTLGGSVS